MKIRYNYDRAFALAEKKLETPTVVHTNGKCWEVEIDDTSILWTYKSTVLRATPFWMDNEGLVLYEDEELPSNIFCEFSTTDDCNPLSMFEIPFHRYFDDNRAFWAMYINTMTSFLNCISQL